MHYRMSLTFLFDLYNDNNNSNGDDENYNDTDYNNNNDNVKNNKYNSNDDNTFIAHHTECHSTLKDTVKPYIKYMQLKQATTGCL